MMTSRPTTRYKCGVCRIIVLVIPSVSTIICWYKLVMTLWSSDYRRLIVVFLFYNLIVYITTNFTAPSKDIISSQANPPKYDRAENLASLLHLNESCVLHTLRQRFGSNLIHTQAANILLLINPSRKLSVYNTKVTTSQACMSTLSNVQLFFSMLNWSGCWGQGAIIRSSCLSKTII